MTIPKQCQVDANNPQKYCWSIFTGCSKVSEGCENCIQEELFRANGLSFDLTYHPKATTEVIEWRRPGIVTICPSSDFFHEEILSGDLRIYRFVHDTVKKSPEHVFMFLTKRPENMKWVFTELWKNDIPCNVLCGVSVENQKRADERLPVLMEIETPGRFINAAPLLGPIDLNLKPGAIRCVNCFAEYGPRARLFDSDWADDLLNQCKRAGVNFWYGDKGYNFMKAGSVNHYGN